MKQQTEQEVQDFFKKKIAKLQQKVLKKYGYSYNVSFEKISVESKEGIKLLFN